MGVSIRMTEEETKLAKDYAKLHGITLSQALKQALFEKIEDELDIQLADKAYFQYLKGGKKAVKAEEVEKKYGI
jgi:predicted DNA-binding protein